MKKKIYICDICGADLSKFSSSVRIQYKKFGLTHYWDLCGSCFRNMEDWIREQKEKEG